MNEEPIKCVEPELIILKPVYLRMDNNYIMDKKEKKIIDNMDKTAPNCFDEISKIELSRLSKIINNVNIIKSIRASYIKNRMIKTHHILLQNKIYIIEEFKKGKDIKYLSKKYYGSPLNILRIILSETKTKSEIKEMLNNKNLLEDTFRKDFEWATKHDIYALYNQDKIHILSELFEKDVEKFLIKHNIKYKTQKELTEEQMLINNVCTCTPDFLVLTNVFINGFKISWIDAKNFYGSNINFVKNSLHSQTQKYISNYGTGLIVFDHGVNEIYKEFDKNILFIGYNDLINSVRV